MTPLEIRIFASLALKLGMKIAEVITLMKQHGVTQEQIAAADIVESE